MNPPTTQRRALVAITSALLARGLTACGTAVGEIAAQFRDAEVVVVDDDHQPSVRRVNAERPPAH